MDNFDVQDWFDWSIYFQSAVFGSIGLAGVVGNAVVIWLTTTASSLKTVPTCWFIFDLAVCDLALSLIFIMESWATHFPHSLICSVVGYLYAITGLAAQLFPPLIAYSRYVRLCHVGISSFALSKYNDKFSLRNVTIISACVWVFTTCLLLPFPILGCAGPDLGGFCSLTMSSLTMKLYFNLTVLATIAAAYVGVIIFYRKIARWLRAERSLPNTDSVVAETQSFLKMMRWICVMPLVMQGPSYIFYFMANFHLMPYWLVRPFNGFWFAVSALDPWITLLINQQYKRALLASRIYAFIPFKLNVQIPNVNEQAHSGTNKVERHGMTLNAASSTHNPRLTTQTRKLEVEVHAEVVDIE